MYIRNLFRTSAQWGLLLLLITLLAACGGGADTVETPGSGTTVAVDTYTGPPPTTTDIQSFKLNVWDNLVAANRCGSCHSTGGQTPQFVRNDDVNLAYAAANTVVDLEQPGLSRLVTKVAEGHNCWLASDSACGDVMTAYIAAWAGDAAGSSRQIQLVAPPIKDPGDSKNFPVDPTLFGSTVWPLLTAHCADCHTSSADTPQAPFFAGSDVAASYDAAKSKIDLDTPANSRLVVRLGDEFHNCWSDCENDADTMQAAIQTLADQIPTSSIDPQLVNSKALTLGDGIVASGGTRHEANQIALYEFKTGEEDIAYDTSGVEPALDLTLSGDYRWVGGWGIEFNGGKAQGTTTNSRKLANLIRSTGEYSIEAWTIPANVTQEGPARIISYSGGTDTRNFTLGQTQYNYDFLHRSSTTDGNGQPALSTADADERLQATQQHVVVTFDPANGRRIYVNGEFSGDIDTQDGGGLTDWDDSLALIFGNEASGDRPWEGTLRLVAIHNRALTGEQILQNFDAGVGEKFFLLFSLGDLVDIPDSYILFEVSQFDSYSYLFHSPTFVSLDSAAEPDGLVISGLRIGINGQVAEIGQSFSTMLEMVSSSQYGPGGQRLSDGGAVIALEQGSELDEFFLSFEVLGDHTHVITEPAVIQPGPPPDLAPVSDIGLRTFEKIHYTMAAVTDVSPSQSAVKATFDTVKQQLPSVENIDGFLSAHQMAVSQLAIEHCNALVDDQGQTTRADYFPGFDFGSPPATALDSAAERDLIIDPLLERMIGSNLDTQPAAGDVRVELNDLMDTLTACATPACATPSRTADIVKASCAAVLGSAALLLQ